MKNAAVVDSSNVTFTKTIHKNCYLTQIVFLLFYKILAYLYGIIFVTVILLLIITIAFSTIG